VQHIVEIADIGDRDSACLDGAPDSRGALRVEGFAQVEGIRHGVEQGSRGNIGLVGVDGRAELDAIDTELGGEIEPFLDGEIGVAVPPLAWCQLLKCCREHADGHERGIEFTDGHSSSLAWCATSVSRIEKGHNSPWK
jgi:hypothetical protein